MMKIVLNQGTLNSNWYIKREKGRGKTRFCKLTSNLSEDSSVVACSAGGCSTSMASAVVLSIIKF